MNQTEFRAWNKKTKEMWNAKELMEYPMLIKPDGSGFGYRSNVCSAYDEDFSYMIPMQYTGLLDKLGEKIFVGDIVEMYFFGGGPIPGRIKTPVFLDEGIFAVMKMNNEIISLREAIRISNKTKKGLKIIGNIYQDSIKN